MAKKNFTGGLSSLLGDAPQLPQTKEEKEPEKPASKPKEVVKTSQIGTKDNETRATFIVHEQALEKLKAIAYWDRLQIKDVVGSALEGFISAYEKANGPIQPTPKK